jgi:hypothetical protein
MMMSRADFNIEFAALLNAFPHSKEHRDEKTQEIYYQMLGEIPIDRFKLGVLWCIDHSGFFPTIAQLGSASFWGNPEWRQALVKQKREDFQKKVGKLQPPLTAQQKTENQKRVMKIIDKLTRKKKKKIATDQEKQDIYKRMVETKFWSDSELLALAKESTAKRLQALLDEQIAARNRLDMTSSVPVMQQPAFIGEPEGADQYKPVK